MRSIFATIVLLLSSLSAYAQAPAVTELPPLSGAAIGSGYSAANGTLFIGTSASLQSANFPFTISYDLIAPSTGGGVVSTGTSPPSGSGITIANNTTFGDVFHLGGQIRPSSGFSTSLCTTGKMCSIALIDSTRHHYCWVWTANHAFLYIDGIVRDELAASQVGSYTPSTTVWTLSNGLPANATVFDMRVFSKALTADECVYISRLNQASLIPNSGSTNTGLLANWPLNNCVASGALRTCTDVSGNSNTATNAKSPPVVVVTSPSPGAVSGAVSMQSTCTDPSGTLCTQVCYLVDNVQVSASCPTVAPFTFSWDSTKIIDGAHTITAVGFNIANTIGTSAGVSITAANGISAKTVSVNSATGSDSNNCVSAPCLTMAHVRSAITFLGGDTFNVIGTFTDSAVFQLCGPLGGCGTQNFYPSADMMTMTTTGGACNPFTETTTGCGIINVTGATDGIQIINGANVTVSNLAVLGPANTNTTLSNMGIHVISSLPSYIASTGITITNNIVTNFGYNIYLNGSASSFITGYTVSDNWVTSTPVHVNPGPLTCIRADAGTQGTMQSNLVTQCGGQSGNNGNGILFFNFPAPPGAPLSLMQFNVIHDFGWNDTPNTGGPVGVYVINGEKATIQFNESYNGIPNPALFNGHNAIDFDCYDIDDGVNDVTEQYNYAHNCPVQAGFNIVTNGFTTNPNWKNNNIRYNISENSLNCISFNGSGTKLNFYAYNNTCVSNLGSQFGNVAAICWNLPTSATVVNNLCVYTGTFQVGYINLAYSSLPLASDIIIQNNDYWATSASAANPPVWVYNKIFNAPQIFTSLSTYQTASIDANHPSGLDANSLNVDPQFVGTPGTGGTCYTDASGSPPAGPKPCPSPYQLSGSNLKGKGVNVTTLPGTPPANPTVDYYGNAVPNAVLSGWNIGAYGGP